MTPLEGHGSLLPFSRLCYTTLCILERSREPALLSDYGPLVILIAAAIVFPVGGIVTSWLLGALRLRPNHPNPVKNDTYECGVETIGSSWIQFNFRYYYFALLFVIFDIEAVFLLPWAVYFRQLQLFGLIEMALFILILVVGYVYAWKKRALEWV